MPPPLPNKFAPYIIGTFLIAFALGVLLRDCQHAHSIGKAEDSLAVHRDKSAFISGQIQRDTAEITALRDSLSAVSLESQSLRAKLASAKSKVIVIKPITDKSDVSNFLGEFGRENQ